MKCKKCNASYVESESPANHYGTPSGLCLGCEREENAKDGDWLQDVNGHYYRKNNTATIKTNKEIKMTTPKLHNDSPEDYKNLLLDLLADMHGDGGHYALKHGVKKAVEDALEKFYNTKSTLRDLLEERKTKSTTLP